MNFPKKQAQRLIPEYLLDYTEKLQTSHPDPTESWGGGSGGSYTSGDGIDITNNVISVDNTVAKKSEIPSRAKSPFLGVRQTTDGTVLFSETGEDDDYYSVYHVTEPVRVNLRALNPNFGSGLTSSYNTSTRALDVAVDTTTVALKSDIPSLDGYATQTWVQNQGYSTFSGSYNDLTDKPTFATVATSGSYNDLTDKPTIPDTTNFVTTDTMQNISGTKTFLSGISIKDTYEGTLEGYRLSISTGQFQYEHFNGELRESILFALPTSKPSGTVMPPTYTLATDDDIHNPTITFTQGGTTKGSITLNQSTDQTIDLDAGGSGGGSSVVANPTLSGDEATLNGLEVDGTKYKVGGGGGSATNMVTTDTNQDITGEKTFVGNKRIKFKQSSQSDRLGFTGFDANGTEIGYFEMSKSDMDFSGSPISNILGYWSNVNSAPNPSSDVMLGFKYFTNDSDGNTRDYRLVVPPRYNELRATRYIPISVNGNIADNTGNINVPTETLVFTLADNSTVTVNVMTSATSSTTTTS